MNDLYRLVNGPWLDTHTIPDDRGVDGTFHALRDTAESDVRAIVETSSGLPGTLYRSFMDTNAINAAGTTPLNEDLALIDAPATNAFLQALGSLDRTGVGAPLGFYITKDSAGDNNTAYLVQSGLGLPDEAYYRDPAHADTLADYQKHVATMLGYLDPTYLGGLEPTEAAERIISLEKDIAAGHWDVVASRDRLKTFNPMPFSALPKSVQTILRAAGMPELDLINMMPSYVEHLDTLLTDQRLDDWKLWAIWHILYSRAGLLTEEISRTNFDFYGTKLSGATEQRDRWKRGVSLAENYVGEEIGQEFVAQHFAPAAKAHMLELVDYLLDAYKERISALPWMTEETRTKALVKLSKFRAKIGYPDVWRSFDGLEFSPHGADLVANARAGAAFVHDYELAKLGKPVDKNEWVTTPQTVNAFYHPVLNDITFPAAILRPPFYSPEADAATNFGAIGAVIGHEIGHGFDDQGSQYDGDGNLQSWWSDEDRAAFEELTAKLVTQFNGLVPAVLAGTDSAGVNGEFTLGENIGDLGGLGIAVVAYKRYVAEHNIDPLTDLMPVDTNGSSPEMRGVEYNGLQRLFLSWARIWRTKIRPELATQYLAVDPHSPAEFRCNVIAANVAEFYEAFPVEADSAMWIEPDQRVTIW